ncbi:MAG: hypothetical protein QW491_12895 [Thermoproteota archaeon]
MVFLSYVVVSIVYFGKDIYEGKLLLFADAFFYDYPIRLYYADNLINHKGLHLWLPYEYLGMPILGILQSGILYPLNWLYFFFPAAYVFNLNFIIHYVLAAFFTYMYARLIGIGLFPAFVSGLVFGFSGYLLGYVKSFTSLRNAATWLPLLMYLYEWLRRTGNVRYAAAASIVVALQVFAGHYQICIYTYMMLGLFVVYHAKSLKMGYRFRFIIASLSPIFVGSLIALPQLLATMELSHLSWRSGRGYEFFVQGSFDPRLSLVWLIPFANRLWSPSWVPGEATLSPPLPFFHLLAVWSLLVLRRFNVHVMFWGLVYGVALFLALGENNPFYKLFYYVPVYNLFRIPFRHLLEHNFAIAILGAIALDRLSLARKRPKSLMILVGIWMIGSIIAAIWTRSLFHNDVVGSQATMETFIVYVLFILWICFLPYSTRTRSYIAMFILCFLVVFCGHKLDSFRQNDPWVYNNVYHFDNPFFVHLKSGLPSIYEVNHLVNDSVFEVIRKTTPYERSAFITSHPTLYNIPSKVHTINGYDPLIIKSTAELLDMRYGVTSSNWKGLLLNNTILSLLNVRYVLIPRERSDEYDIILKGVRAVFSLPTFRYITLSGGNWDSINSTRVEKEFHLSSPDGHSVSMIYQPISVKANTWYLICLRAKVLGGVSSSVLSVDFYGYNYDFAEQQLDIDSSEIKSEYKSFFGIINTGNDVPPDVTLRIFTFSKSPVLVKDIELREFDHLSPPVMSVESKHVSEVPVYKKVYENEHWLMYENTNCIPRAFAVEGLDLVTDISEVKKKLVSLELNPLKTAMVFPHDLAKIGRTEFTSGTVRIIDHDTDRIVISANFEAGPGFVVLSEQFYPGWIALIDGRRASVYQVHGVLRGVVVPQGVHTIVFIYQPFHIYTATIIGTLVFLCMVFLVLSPPQQVKNSCRFR